MLNFGIIMQSCENSLRTIVKKRAILGIHTYALTPVNNRAVRHTRSGGDNSWSFERTWMPKDAYTATAEVQVYGDKVAICTYGETQMSTIITSPAIAEAMRQILKIMMDYYKKTFPQKQ